MLNNIFKKLTQNTTQEICSVLQVETETQSVETNYQEQLELSSHENAELQEIHELIQANENVLQRIPQVEADRVDAIEALNARQDTLKSLRNELNSKEQVLLELEVELQEVQQTLKRENKEIAYAQAQILSTENNILDKKDEVRKAIPVVEAKVAKREKLQKLCAERQVILTQKEKEQEELTAKLKDLRAQITQFNIFLNDVNPQIEMLEGHLVDNLSAHKAQSELNQRLDQEIQEKQKRLDDLDDELSQVAFSLMTLQNEIREKGETTEILAKQINELEENLLNPKKEKEELSKKIKDIDELNKARKEYRDRLVLRLNELDEVVNMLNQELTSKDEEALNLKKQENVLKERIKVAQVQVERLQQAINFKVKNLEEKNNELSELKAVYSHSLSEIEELGQMSEELTEELTINTALLHSKQERLAKAQKRKELVEKNIEKKRNLLNQRNGEVSN